MRVPHHPTNIRRMLGSRVKQLTARKPLLAASLVSVERRCGKPGCRCVSGEKHRGHQLTYKVRGKTRTVYVPVDLTEEVREWIDEYHRLKCLIQEISLYACGRTLQLAKDYHCDYVFTFKPGHMPAVWEDFQSLFKLCPENTLERSAPEAFTRSTAGSTACPIRMTRGEPGGLTPSNARKRWRAKRPRSPGSRASTLTPTPSRTLPPKEDDIAGTLKTKDSIAKRTAA